MNTLEAAIAFASSSQLQARRPLSVLTHTRLLCRRHYCQRMFLALTLCQHVCNTASVLRMWQGVVAESSGLRDRIREVVAEAHSRGLFLFTYGNENNDISYYQVLH